MQTNPRIPSDTVIAVLESEVAGLMQEIPRTEMWCVLTDPATDPGLVTAIMREVYLEIFSYNASIVEATIALIGQMPRSLPVRRLKAMLHHQADEFDHGEMGLRDHVALGGDEVQARSRRMSPASFAAAGVWWMMVQQRDPFAYLGAEYLFEALTPLVADAVQPFLARKGFQEKAMGFIRFHAAEDPAHTRLMRQLIRDVVDQYPEAADSILHGMRCFRAVYPLPVWQGAFDRAVAGWR
jgi:hypothetical protein